jgi:hypothetical protein
VTARAVSPDRRRGKVPRHHGAVTETLATLPNLIVIGAMKCGTTALHELLDRHPDIAMSSPKELNFFLGEATGTGVVDTLTEDRSWARGNWHRGLEWYAGQFAPSPVRGEASPGYTSPHHPEVAGRMAQVVPHARLVYLVRDPVARAVSQYHHHRAEGTEQRPMAEALLDPASQYLSRGRYFERLEPFLAHYAPEAIAVVTQEELRASPAAVLDELHALVGVEPLGSTTAVAAGPRPARPPEPLDQGLVAAMTDALQENADRLRAFTGRTLDHWSV